MRPTILGLTLAAAAAGCGSDAPVARSTAAVQGTWTTACATAGGFDEKRTLTFSGSNASIARAQFTSADGSCTNGILGAMMGTTFSLGADVTATLVGTVSVTAQELTLNFDPTPEYTIVYVDAWAANGPYLFLGDLSATQGLDGTAPGKRPTVLDAFWSYQKQ